MFDRRRSRRKIRCCFDDCRYVEEAPFRWVRAHWEPLTPAFEIAELIDAHVQRWPQDHGYMQCIIKDGFLTYFPGPEGDVFRRMVDPPPLYRYMNG